MARLPDSRPSLPVGFRVHLDAAEASLTHRGNREVGFGFVLASVVVPFVSALEHSDRPLPLWLGALFAAPFGFLGLTILVNRTTWTFRRRSFSMRVHPLPLKRRGEWSVDEINRFEVVHVTEGDSDRHDLVMVVTSPDSLPPPVVLFQGLRDSAEGEELVHWLTRRLDEARAL